MPLAPKIIETRSEKPVEIVEMHSIDTQELVQPKKQAPKPPSTYFKPPPRKDLCESPKRTTVIKITEYPTENSKAPAKFEFLEEKEKNGCESFDSELAKTLSRVNLKRSEAVVTSNGVSKHAEKNCANGMKFNAPQYVPVQNITQDELSSVKKTLRTFEKNSGANTIIVQIPKRAWIYCIPLCVPIYPLLSKMFSK